MRMARPARLAENAGMTAQPTRGAALAQVLLQPRSIALVGASDDPAKNSGRPQRFMRQAGYAGTLYPVNPKRAEVQGERAWPSLAALPEVPEHVFLLTPTETVLETARECARLGVKVLTVLASGFSESGADGAARERELGEIARTSGLRILGPSSLGVINPRNRMLLTGNAAFAEPDMPAGSVFVASHSGSMLGALVSRGRLRGVGFAGLVSVGSEVDLSVGEVCAATLDDPGISGYLLFLESLHDGAALRSFAIEAARRGKPVVAYKLGRSAAAAEMTATHTGALAGEDDIADAFLKDCGIARIGILEALMECHPLATRVPLPGPDAPGPKRVGVVTTTGGGAAMVVDQLGIRGIDVQPASADTLAKLAAAGVAATAGRVLDLTLAGTKYETMKATLEIMLAAPEFDLVLAVVGSSARMQPQLAVKPIIDTAATAAKPLAAMIVPEAPQAIAQLTAAGVPCFRNPEACADVIAAVFGRRSPAALPQVADTRAGAAAATLSEAQAYELFDRLGVPHAPSVLVAIDGEPPAQLPFEYPVVVKVCSAAIPHKTEVGGVILGVQDRAQLQAALRTLRANLAERAPGVEANEAIVQPMCRGLGEVLVGYKVDRDAGAIVMLAAGGIWAEVMRDRSIRLAPVSVEGAREMIGEVRSLQTLAGLRGRPRGDLEALARAVSALSQLAVRPELRVAEAEVNPLLVLAEGQGVLAVDALVAQR